jgi:glutathione S-transferase
MKIFGDSRSTNTRKVLTTLAELDATYELVHVDFALGEHKQEGHLARQPFGQMPALEDEGFVLYETHAMCRYINHRAGGQLMPRELRARALADQWMSIESANFAGHAMKFVYNYLLRAPQEPAALEHAGAAFGKTLEVLAAQLSWHPFIAGQTFTLADICFMPYFEYTLLTPAKDLISRHPSVLAWWDKVRERPSWQKVAAHA